MLNTSVTGVNSTSFPFNFMVCYNVIYEGMFVLHVAVSLCFILGTPAHSWLLWFSLRAGWKIKPTQVFPLNLTVLELIYCITCAADIVGVLMFKKDMPWVGLHIVFGISWVGRPLMQMCISIEQYLAVIHPIIFLKYKALLYRIVSAAVVWLIATACAGFEGFADVLSHPIYNSVFFIVVTVILFCCVSVLCALKHPGPGDTQIPVQRGRDVGNQQKRNAFNTIFLGLLIILFAYIPPVLTNLIHFIQLDEKLFYCNIVSIMYTFNVLSMMITPLQKLYKNGDMKCLKH